MLAIARIEKIIIPIIKSLFCLFDIIKNLQYIITEAKKYVKYLNVIVFSLE